MALQVKGVPSTPPSGQLLGLSFQVMFKLSVKIHDLRRYCADLHTRPIRHLSKYLFARFFRQCAPYNGTAIRRAFLRTTHPPDPQAIVNTRVVNNGVLFRTMNRIPLNIVVKLIAL